MKAPDFVAVDTETTQRDGKTSASRVKQTRVAIWFYHLQLAGYQSTLTAQKIHL